MMTLQMVSILGDGQMALTLADALVHRGVRVRLWGPFPADIHTLATLRVSPRLPGFLLPSEVELVGEDQLAFENSSMVFSAIPTQFVRSVWTRMHPYVTRPLSIVSVSKGFEIATLKRPTEVIADCLRGDHALCALSGPTIAAELARRLPASMVAASSDSRCAAEVQDLLRVPWLRIYRHDDVVGVETAGAAKNVIALAAGMVDGLQAGDNAKSALLARGLAEIARLGVALGARVDTFFGVAGVGDLATTCFSPEGRNRTCGERLARNEPLERILAGSTSVVEGVPTTRALKQLADTLGVDMPITAAVHAILFEGLSPRDAIRALMSREPKAEQVG